MIRATYKGQAASGKVWTHCFLQRYAYRGPEKTTQNLECDWSLSLAPWFFPKYPFIEFGWTFFVCWNAFNLFCYNKSAIVAIISFSKCETSWLWNVDWQHIWSFQTDSCLTECILDYTVVHTWSINKSQVVSFHCPFLKTNNEWSVRFYIISLLPEKST